VKVLIADNLAPFARGDADAFATDLVSNLKRRGHESELLRIPIRSEPTLGIATQMAMVRAFELDNVDRVVALRFPTILIEHPEKTVWLTERFRPEEPDDELLKVVLAATTQSLEESRSVFAAAPSLGRDVQNSTGVVGEILLAPLDRSEKVSGGEAAGYIFAGGTVNGANRQRLLIESLVHASPAVHLVIAGSSTDSGAELELTKLADRLGVADRLTLRVGTLTPHEIAEYVNAATACVQLPLRDFLGTGSRHAAMAAKPLITTTDSAGIIDLIEDGVTGWLCDSTSVDLGRAMSEAVAVPSDSRDRGAELSVRLRAAAPSWDAAIDRLLA
jgi:Glycosyl transferases group 1